MMTGLKQTWLGLATLLGILHQAPVVAAEQPLWSAAAAQQFCNELPSVSSVQLQSVLGDYAAVLQREAPAMVQNLKQVDSTHVEALLQSTLSRGWSVLDLVVDSSFATAGPCSLLLSAELLQQVDAAYNLHGLWMVNAPLANGTLPLRYLLFGKGKLALGYARSAVVKVADYDFSGGKYAYTPFVLADLVSSTTAGGLTNIRVLESAAANFTSFKGPRNATVLSMLLNPAGVLVSYSLFGVAGSKLVPELLIEKR
jgi:hypothetical protein